MFLRVKGRLGRASPIFFLPFLSFKPQSLTVEAYASVQITMLFICYFLVKLLFLKASKATASVSDRSTR
jgi:hypothetical protein